MYQVHVFFCFLFGSLHVATQAMTLYEVHVINGT